MNTEFNTFAEAIESGFIRPGYPRVIEIYKSCAVRISDCSPENSTGYRYCLIANDKVFCETIRIYGNNEVTKSGHLGAYQPMFYKPDFDKALIAARRFIDKL